MPDPALLCALVIAKHGFFQNDNKRINVVCLRINRCQSVLWISGAHTRACDTCASVNLYVYFFCIFDYILMDRFTYIIRFCVIVRVITKRMLFA